MEFSPCLNLLVHLRVLRVFVFRRTKKSAAGKYPGGRRSITPWSSRSRSRATRTAREISGTPRWMSLKECTPVISSRTMSGVQRVAKISDAFAIGQN